MMQSLFVSHSSSVLGRALSSPVTSRMLLSSPAVLDLLKPEVLDQITPLITAATTIVSSTASTASATSFSDILSLIDFSKYWFMFPTCVCVATCSISSGIGGAALFGPIFLIVFPALGSQYMLESPAAAVGKFQLLLWRLAHNSKDDPKI